MHTPPWQASPLVQVLPSSQGVASAQRGPARAAPAQLAVLVQVRSSSRAALPRIAAPPPRPPLWQVSSEEQALPSSQLAPVSGATVQLAVPLQVRVLHWS